MSGLDSAIWARIRAPPGVGPESARSSVAWMRPPVRRIVSRSASGNDEVLEQGHDVRERLVEREGVRPGRLHEVRPDAVEHRVGRLVDDDVVREAGEHDLAGQVPSRTVVRGREVPEQQRPLAPVVVGVGLGHRMGKDAQPVAERRAAPTARPLPADRPPERRLEPLDRGAHHAVDHLLVESRVEVARFEAAPEQHVERVEVGGAVVAVVRRVVVDDRDLAADRPRLQRLERHGDRHVVPERPAATRVEGEHLERAMVAIARRSRLRQQRQAPSSAAGRLRDDVLQPARLVDDERGARVGPVGARRPPLDDLGDDLALAAAVRPDPARRADEGRVHLDPGPGREADIGRMVVDERPDPRGRETSFGPDQGLGGGQAPAGRLAPPEALLRVGAHARHRHPTRAEAVDERLPVPPVVVGDDLRVGGDDRAQVVAEIRVDGRTVVERPDADRHEVPRSLRRLGGEAHGEIRVDPRAIARRVRDARDAHEVARAARMDAEEGVEDGRHQDRSPVVRLRGQGQGRGVRRRPQRRPQGAAHPERGPELRRDLEQRVGSGPLGEDQPIGRRRLHVRGHGRGVDPAARALDGLDDRVAELEMPEQRDDVGQALMEGRSVGSSPARRGRSPRGARARSRGR